MIKKDIIAALILFVSCAETIAQTDTPFVVFTQATIMNDKLAVYIPEQFTRVKKRTLKMNRPPVRLNEAIGYKHNDGSKAFFYRTDIAWNFTDKGIAIWDIAFKTAESFSSYQFIESGFFKEKINKSSTIYYLKILAIDNKKEVCALLTFSELEGKILYGLYSSPANNYEVWDHASNEMLQNQYVRS